MRDPGFRPAIVRRSSNSAAGDVGHRHADDHAEDEGAQHHALLVLCVRLGVVRVRMQRVLVHREKREPGAVRLADRAPRPVREELAHRELFEVAAIAHDGIPVNARSIARRATSRRSASLSVGVTTRRAASR